MNQSSRVMLVGLAAALVAFAAVHFVGTASSRELLRHPQPELAWLKQEFHLSDAEFARISEMHKAYLPKCAARCRFIAQETAKLDELLACASSVTPEIEEVIARRARMRSECESEMLKHFIAVSHTMPAEQGRRYLAWVREQTAFSGQGMEKQHDTHESAHHH